MVKKVTLDTLDIEELEIPLPERTAPAEEENGKKSPRWLTAKWLWISALALVMLIAAGGVSYWWIGAQKTASRLPSQVVPTAAPLQTGPAMTPLQTGAVTSQVNDFIITLQDDTGKYLVMMCDLTLELSAGQDDVIRQNMVEVRKIIYELLKKTRVVSLREPGIRNGLKEDINKSVSGLLGQDAIKAVYFTKFVVL